MLHIIKYIVTPSTELRLSVMVFVFCVCNSLVMKNKPRYSLLCIISSYNSVVCERVGAVSYTHLDVYKRQNMNRGNDI